MALKDWKLQTKDSIGNVWINKKRNLEIAYSNTSKNLEIYNHTGYKYSEVVIRKDFKTKSQALKFARAYMRTH